MLFPFLFRHHQAQKKSAVWRRYALPVTTSIMTMSIVLGALSACPSRAHLNTAMRQDFRVAYQGNSYYLKQSVYFGPFYDDAQRFLIDPKEFKDLRLMTAPDGDLIVPPPPKGIVPAGTKVKVLDISFASSAQIFRRPLFTPRYNTWLILKVARFAGDANVFRQGEFIYVVPTMAKDRESLNAVLQALLSPESIDTWLQSRSDEVRQAIFEKRAQQGMTYDELLAALGLPEKMHRGKEGGQSLDTARFGSTEVVLLDHRVREIRQVDMDSPMQGETQGE